MTIMRLLSAALFIIIYGCNTKQDTKYDLVISNVSIVNVDSGTIREGQDVFIKDSIIIMIRPHENVEGNIVDGSGKFLMPGFWDMHVHIQDSSYLRLFLDHGIVGVRDMGGCTEEPGNGCESLCPAILSKWKTMVRDGLMQGPRLYISGRLLTGTGWPTSLPATTAGEVRQSFEVILNDKVDFVKVYEKIPADAYKEIARLSKLHKLDFAGHVSDTMLLSDISNLGQKSVEHLREPILYSFTDDEAELETFMAAEGYTDDDRAYVSHWIADAGNVIASFKLNNTWFTPTMAVQYARQRYSDSAWINHALRKELPAPVTQGLHRHLNNMRNESDRTGDSLWWMAHRKLVRRLNDAGIGLLAGTDIACQGGIPGYTLHEELWLMVEAAGLSPRDALRTATTNPCRYFGLKRNGLVSEGYYADLVLLGANPLEDIRNSIRIGFTIVNGKLVAASPADP